MNNDIKTIVRLSDTLKRADYMRDALESVRSKLHDLAQSLQQSVRVKYTGFCVLLKRDGDGWKCVGIVNPERDDEITKEFDMVLPIPDPNTVTEFNGW